MFKRILVILLWLIGVSVLAVIALAVALPFLIDPNDYRDRIERIIAERSGRDVAIEGELELSVFPWLGLETGRIVVGNPPAFDATPMAAIDQASVRIRLLPLLRREVEADNVVVRGLSLHLITLEDGRANWDDLVADTAPSDTAPGVGSGLGMAALAIQGVAVRDGTIRWDDRELLETYTLEGLQLETGSILPGRPVPVSLRTNIEGTALPERLQVELDGIVTVPLASDAGSVRDLVFSATGDAVNARLQARSLDLQPGGDQLRIEGARIEGRWFGQQGSLETVRGEIDLAMAQATLGDLALRAEVAGLDIQARTPSLALDYGNRVARLTDLAAALRSGDLHADVALGMTEANYGTGRFVLESLTGDLRYDDLLATVSAPSLSLRMAKQRLDIPAFELESDGARVSGGVSGERLLIAPRLSGQLQASDVPLRTFLARAGVDVDTRDEQALTNAGLSTSFVAGLDSLDLQNLELRIDETTMRGFVTLAGLGDPDVRFDLNVSALDLDRYMTPDTQAGQGGDEAVGAAAAIVLPVMALRDVRGEGRLRVARLSSGGLDVDDLDVTLRSRDGLVSLAPIRARLYGGTSEGEIQVDAAADPPALVVRERLVGIDVGPALSAAGVTDRLSGRGNLDIDLNARGVDGDALVQSLGGRVTFDVRDGAVRGFDLRQILTDAQRSYDSLRGREPTVAEVDPDDETRFTSLAASLDLRGGTAFNDDLLISAPLFRVSGRGSADLVREQIDYLLTVNVVSTLEGQAGSDLAELRGIAVPVRITGAMDAPRYRVDLAEMGRAHFEEEIREERERLEERARERIERELQNRLLDRLRPRTP